MCTNSKEELKVLVLEEVELYFIQHGQLPKQVMVTDRTYRMLRKESLTFNSERIYIVSCTRVLNSECTKHYQLP